MNIVWTYTDYAGVPDDCMAIPECTKLFVYIVIHSVVIWLKHRAKIELEMSVVDFTIW